jgi:hypothetical protein
MKNKILKITQPLNKKVLKLRGLDIDLLSSSGGENFLKKHIKTKEQADSFMRQLEWLSKHPNEPLPW